MYYNNEHNHEYGNELPMTQARRILTWLVLAVLVALVTYIGFRGYFTPEMLFDFANSFYC